MKMAFVTVMLVNVILQNAFHKLANITPQTYRVSSVLQKVPIKFVKFHQWGHSIEFQGRTHCCAVWHGRSLLYGGSFPTAMVSEVVHNTPI